jgi:hypothetical protein
VRDPKSDDEVTLYSRLNEIGVVIDMGKEKEPKGYWEAVNGLNGHM